MSPEYGVTYVSGRTRFARSCRFGTSPGIARLAPLVATWRESLPHRQPPPPRAEFGRGYGEMSRHSSEASEADFQPGAHRRDSVGKSAQTIRIQPYRAAD